LLKQAITDKNPSKSHDQFETTNP